MTVPRFAAALGAAAWLACASPDPPPPASLADGRYAMGTVLELTLHGRDAVALARARDRSFALAARLDGLLSRYVESSDVSRVNAAGGAPVEVDPQVAGLLVRSLRFHRQTRGAFDVTIGPLVALWIDAATTGRLPADAAVAAARSRIGPSQVSVEGSRVALRPGATLDLGGVAKGFALDRMLPLLREEGVEAALLSFGQSSVWALGRPPDAPGWRLLARSPDGGFAGVMTLRDRALSVSGSLGQGSEIEGRRYGHVLDPRTGWPLTRRRQALVVAGDGTLAEALSTALLVLGPEEGIAMVEETPDCEALLLDADGSRAATRGFDAATAFEPLAQGAPRTFRTVLHAEGAQLPGL
ncbi:MAG: FAD:protein FMN transferase [Myxococcota bacterium]